MKIFSNFSTSYGWEILEENHKIYNKDDVVFLRRSKFYFLFHIIPYFIAYVLVLIIIFSIFFNFSLHPVSYMVFFIVWLLIFWFQIVYKFFKFICDFTVITPWGITTYKQKWILHSVLKEIPANKIKAVEVFRPALLWNIFGYGSVDIIADMNDSNYRDVDNEAPWIVWLSYVDAPHIVKSQISKVCFK